MTRNALRGLALFGLMAAVVVSTARAQNPDVVSVRDRKDNSIKKLTGTLTVSSTGFQVVGADKKAAPPINPDDVVGVVIGDLPGVDRGVTNSASTKEDNKKYAEALVQYKEANKAGLPERSARYLQYKAAYCNTKLVDEVDDKDRKAKAEDAVKEWKGFLNTYRVGWELWPATRAYSRLQTELGQYAEAAAMWNKLSANKELPADARMEAQIQEIDMHIRGKQAVNAIPLAGEALKSAAGGQKERLAIYEIAAKAAADGKAPEGVEAIKKEMDKTKDPSVHATGFAMTGELHLLAGKPRDAMWSFLWVETVLNQDRDEAFKAVARLASLFESGPLADDDQARKYRDKLKRIRGTF
jgi:tetratricopeptide (TPR) repeat protein